MANIFSMHLGYLSCWIFSSNELLYYVCHCSIKKKEKEDN